MKGSKYRDLVAWKAARVLARDIYVATRTFPRDEQFGLVQQMRRASVSIMSNIGEGFGRSSDAEQKQFCIVARGSALELESQLVIAEDVRSVAHVSGGAYGANPRGCAPLERSDSILEQNLMGTTTPV